MGFDAVTQHGHAQKVPKNSVHRTIRNHSHPHRPHVAPEQTFEVIRGTPFVGVNLVSTNPYREPDPGKKSQ